MQLAGVGKAQGAQIPGSVTHPSITATLGSWAARVGEPGQGGSGASLGHSWKGSWQELTAL